MTDNRSSIASRLSFYRFSFVLQEPDILCELASDKDRHLTDSNCKSCLTKFNIPGISHTKKQYCSFCYRGVCTRCLTNDYYHQETKNLQPICSSCFDAVRIRTLNLYSDLESFRLERIELKKEINLAIQQKLAFTEDRKALESQVDLFKKDLATADIEKNVIIDKLKSQNSEFLTKASQEAEKLESEKGKVINLNNKLLKHKKEIAEIKEKEVEMNKQKEMLLEYRSRIDLYKEELRRENRESKSESCLFELTVIEGKLEDINGKSKHTDDILNGIKQNIHRNQENIEKLYEKLNSLKNKENDSFSLQEEARLTELKNQIKELDDIIRIKGMRINENLIRKQSEEYYKKLPVSSYPEIQGNKQEGKNEDHKSCCSKCRVF